MATIAIHQPNFFPYAGFFQKMEQADIFVIMTHCQFEKNNYQNRFNVGDKWHTMSVSSGLEQIKNKVYVDHETDWARIKYNTKKDVLKYFDDSISRKLASTNISIIKRIADMLGIETNIVYDYETELKGTERLVDLCVKYNATEYLSGISGKNYLELEKFGKIKVRFQENIDTRPIIDLI